jgi:predicted amidohydrolase
LQMLSLNHNLDSMRVGFVQTKPMFGDKTANIEKAIAMMESHPADLYVLPELFVTGYAFISGEEVADLAEPAGQGATFAALADFAAGHDCAVVYGFPEQAPEGFYNSSQFIDNKGNRKLYRKLHLFYEESKYFLPGNTPPEPFNYRDVKLGMIICFDWIFPETTRILALQGAQIICHPANLVLPYCQNAMVTRSIENRVFTITANRIGTEKRGHNNFTFTGQSQITGCKGDVIFRADDNKEQIYVADINSEDAKDKNVNALNNLWRDRRV